MNVILSSTDCVRLLGAEVVPTFLCVMILNAPITGMLL